ncbi:MAG: MFS transporter, partial [Alphaproteobacteria bacterium]
MSDAVAAAPVAEKPSGLARIMILSTATVATALVSMALLVMSVVMPQMQGSLSATPDQIAWAVTLNIVASAVCTPPSGWLANRFGRRNVLIWCTAGFTVATALCGTAESLEMLVVFRVLQGALGAPLNPLCNAAVLDAFPKEQHAMATAVFGMGVMIGPMLGPAVGGILAEVYDWRAGFYVMALVSLGTLVGIWAFMRDDTRSPSSLDWTGFLSLSLAVICLQLVLDRGHRSDWFDAQAIVIMAALGLGAAWVCVVHCTTARRPFINPAMIKDRNYLIGMACTLVFGCVSYSPMVLLPPMLHTVAGYPDDLIGWVLSSRGVGAFLGFFVSIGIGKLDPRVGMALGFLTFAGSGAVMTLLDVNFQFWHLLVTSLMQGASAGMVWVPMMVIA